MSFAHRVVGIKVVRSILVDPRTEALRGIIVPIARISADTSAVAGPLGRYGALRAGLLCFSRMERASSMTSFMRPTLRSMRSSKAAGSAVGNSQKCTEAGRPSCALRARGGKRGVESEGRQGANPRVAAQGSNRMEQGQRGSIERRRCESESSHEGPLDK